jgi:hypothetical protein
MSDTTSDEIAAIQAARKASKESQPAIHPSLLPSSEVPQEESSGSRKKKRSSRFDTSLDVSTSRGGGGDGDYEMRTRDDEEPSEGNGSDKPTRLLDSCTHLFHLCVSIERETHELTRFRPSLSLCQILVNFSNCRYCTRSLDARVL